MHGTATYIWHDAQRRYDEVAWDPKPISEAQAEVAARERFDRDGRATRIQIAVGDSTVLDVYRH
jgi:hypothetical protein